MDVKTKNQLILQGITDKKSLFPHLDALQNQPITFEAEFGLSALPDEPGLILIRGARQLGKSTWLEAALLKTVTQNGPASAIYLNGDNILNAAQLAHEIHSYLPLFSPHCKTPRIFIDEITAIPDWEKTIKLLYDAGDTRHVLIVTTGSKAIDLRRGTERLPGRKGRLARTNFLFTPISFNQFQTKCGHQFNHEDLLIAYLITGGSPLAINELIREKKIPEYLAELVKDWILGECANQGRSRNLLTWVSQQLLLKGGSPISLNSLAKDSGAANNTVVRGYIELLTDVLCLSTSFAIDANTKMPLPRKPQKYHWINTLAAIAFSPQEIRSIADFKSLPPTEQGKWFEWLVAQELWRRAAIAGDESPEVQYYFQSTSNELDFKASTHFWIEVKRGQFSPLEFSWFPKVFPKDKLQVVCAEKWDHSNFLQVITFEDFLMKNP